MSTFDDQPLFELIETEVPYEVHQPISVGSTPTEDDTGQDVVEQAR